MVGSTTGAVAAGASGSKADPLLFLRLLREGAELDVGAEEDDDRPLLFLVRRV